MSTEQFGSVVTWIQMAYGLAGGKSGAFHVVINVLSQSFQ